MPRKRKPGVKAISAWVDKALLERIDTLVEQKQKETGLYGTVHRSDILKMVLEEHIDSYINNLNTTKGTEHGKG